jgi:hypothetical protein
MKRGKPAATASLPWDWWFGFRVLRRVDSVSSDHRPTQQGHSARRTGIVRMRDERRLP